MFNPLALAGAITSGVNAVGSVFSSISNAQAQQKNLDYAKDLQRQVFEREDNAVQRRAADMQKAGLSQTLAAGGGAQAGAVVKTEAPQIHGLENIGDGVSGAVNSYYQIKQAQEQNKLLSKQIDQADEQIKNLQQQNQNMRTERVSKMLENSRLAWDLYVSKKLGMKTSDQLNLPTYLMRNLLPGTEGWNTFSDSRRKTLEREKREYERYNNGLNDGIPAEYR